MNYSDVLITCNMSQIHKILFHHQQLKYGRDIARRDIFLREILVNIRIFPKMGILHFIYIYIYIYIYI